MRYLTIRTVLWSHSPGQPPSIYFKPDAVLLRLSHMRLYFLSINIPFWNTLLVLVDIVSCLHTCCLLYCVCVLILIVYLSSNCITLEQIVTTSPFPFHPSFSSTLYHRKLFTILQQHHLLAATQLCVGLSQPPQNKNKILLSIISHC